MDTRQNIVVDVNCIKLVKDLIVSCLCAKSLGLIITDLVIQSVGQPLGQAFSVWHHLTNFSSVGLQLLEGRLKMDEFINIAAYT
jgi:hypothetical protein